MNLIRYSQGKIDFKKNLLLADLNFDGNRHGLKHKHYALFSISWFAPLCEIDHIVIHQKLTNFWKDFTAPFNFSLQETFCAFSFSPRRRWIWSRASPTSSNVSPSSTYFSWLAATYLSLIIFKGILRKSNLQKF